MECFLNYIFQLAVTEIKETYWLLYTDLISVYLGELTSFQIFKTFSKFYFCWRKPYKHYKNNKHLIWCKHLIIFYNFYNNNKHLIWCNEFKIKVSELGFKPKRTECNSPLYFMLTQRSVTAFPTSHPHSKKPSHKQKDGFLLPCQIPHLPTET